MTAGAVVAANELADVIRSHGYAWTFERDIHDGVCQVLVNAGHDVAREVVIEGGRIDLICGRVGIEIKTKGAIGSVLAQLLRYAHEPSVGELILVSTRPTHSRLPATVGGKALAVVIISRGVAA